MIKKVLKIILIIIFIVFLLKLLFINYNSYTIKKDIRNLNLIYNYNLDVSGWETKYYDPWGPERYVVLYKSYNDTVFHINYNFFKEYKSYYFVSFHKEYSDNFYYYIKKYNKRRLIHFKVSKENPKDTMFIK